MTESVPLKHLVSINERLLPESTDPALEFHYVDISAVGRGHLLHKPQRLSFGDAPSRARRLVKGGDTVISTVRTYLRAVWPVTEPANDLVVSTGFAVLTPGPAVDRRYLGWLAQSDIVVDEIVARSIGVSYPAVNPSDIGDVRVPVAPLPQQRRIADFLDAETARIDALIAKKVRLRKVAGSRLRARVANLTGAPVTVGLNDGSASVTHGWQNVRLRRCFTVMDYGIGEASNPAGRVAVLGMANIDDHGRVRGEPGGYVDRVEPRLTLRENDLLFNRTNSLAKVGKLGLVRELPQPTTFASYLVRLRTSAIADPQYLNYALNTPEFLELARSSALPSIGQANLNPSRYTQLRLALPPFDEQRRIVTELDAEQHCVDLLALTLKRQIALLRNRRQALITAAVTGQLDIPGLAA